MVATQWKLTKFLENVPPQELSEIIDVKHTLKRNEVWPLSFLSYRKSVETYTLVSLPIESADNVLQFLNTCFNLNSSQNGNEDLENKNNFNENIFASHSSSLVCWGKASDELRKGSGQHKLLQHVFRRHLKPKKQHEISRLAYVTSVAQEMSKSDFIVDVGSGQGHLSRLLAYGYGCEVFCLDSQQQFIDHAKKFDSQLEQSMNKYLNKNPTALPLPSAPKHGICLLTPGISVKSFEKVLYEFEENESNCSKSYALLGLHTCGDLAPTLIELFKQSANCKAVISVACCYMKLTTEKNNTEPVCYPLSKFLSCVAGHSLTYEARELACHAIDIYIDRLKEEAENLKVHCYRATLEKIIVKHYPDLHHAGLRSVNNAHKMSFENYATQAISRLDGIKLPIDDFLSLETENNLSQWMRVVVLYSVRLMLAPVVESVILLDRMFYLHENGFNALLTPLFDPKLSPRNYALIGLKNKL